MKSKIIGIFLLISLVAPIVVTYSWLQHKKTIVKKEVKRQIIAGIDKEELVLLQFTLKETHTKLRWKHAKEFEYENQMYDIVERETKNDTVSYWCWWDNKETKLNRQLNDLLALALGNNQQNKENQKHLTNFYKSLYLPGEFHTSMTNLRSIKLITSPAPSNWLSVSISPPFTPPQIS